MCHRDRRSPPAGCAAIWHGYCYNNNNNKDVIGVLLHITTLFPSLSEVVISLYVYKPVDPWQQGANRVRSTTFFPSPRDGALDPETRTRVGKEIFSVFGPAVSRFRPGPNEGMVLPAGTSIAAIVIEVIPVVTL